MYCKIFSWILINYYYYYFFAEVLICSRCLFALSAAIFLGINFTALLYQMFSGCSVQTTLWGLYWNIIEFFFFNSFRTCNKCVSAGVLFFFPQLVFFFFLVLFWYLSHRFLLRSCTKHMFWFTVLLYLFADYRLNLLFETRKSYVNCKQLGELLLMRIAVNEIKVVKLN